MTKSERGNVWPDESIEPATARISGGRASDRATALGPPELQLNKANTSDTEAPFLDLHLSISNGFVSSKIYDKPDDFDFYIVNFPFLDGDVPVLPRTGFTVQVYSIQVFFQFIRFARVSSHEADFNAGNKS